MAFPYLSELKDYMELQNDESVNDLLLSVGSAALSFIERYCNITLSVKTKTVTLSGNGTDTIILDDYPITLVSEIKIDNILKDTNDFILNGTRLIYKNGIFPHKKYNIEITYNYGYTEVPSDILLAMFRLAETWYMDARDNRMNINSYSTGHGSFDEKLYQRELPSGVKSLLLPYIRVKV